MDKTEEGAQRFEPSVCHDHDRSDCAECLFNPGALWRFPAPPDAATEECGHPDDYFDYDEVHGLAGRAVGPESGRATAADSHGPPRKAPPDPNLSGGERCATLSSVNLARCSLLEGHPQDAPDRFHRFGLPPQGVSALVDRKPCGKCTSGYRCACYSEGAKDGYRRGREEERAAWQAVPLGRAVLKMEKETAALRARLAGSLSPNAARSLVADLRAQLAAARAEVERLTRRLRDREEDYGYLDAYTSKVKAQRDAAKQRAETVERAWHEAREALRGLRLGSRDGLECWCGRSPHAETCDRARAALAGQGEKSGCEIPGCVNKGPHGHVSGVGSDLAALRERYLSPESQAAGQRGRDRNAGIVRDEHGDVIGRRG